MGWISADLTDKINKMTGAEKTLKWFNDYTKMNGVYPLIAEVEAQLSMAVDEERLNKAENLPISDVVGRDLWEKVDCKDCEGTGLYIPDLEAEYNMHCRVCGGDGKVMKKVES